MTDDKKTRRIQKRDFPVLFSSYRNRKLWLGNTKTVPELLYQTMGLVERKLQNRPPLVKTEKKTIFGADPYMLGYYGGGLLMVSFAQWLLDKSQQSPLQKLYFLSRDGAIVKRVYDIIAPIYPHAPQSRYLLASRRALNTPSIHSVTDIRNSLQNAFFSGTPQSLALYRFGLNWTDECEQACRQAGFERSSDHIESISAAHRSKLVNMFVRLQKSVLEQAGNERESLLEYLSTQGLKTGVNGVVDIGHNASLQASLFKLGELQELHGFYFMTFRPAKSVHSSKTTVNGYLQNFADPNQDCDYYRRHIGVFEFLFLNESDSLMRFNPRRDTQSCQPILVEEGATRRKEIIGIVHDAIVDFATDLKSSLGDKLRDLRVDPEIAFRTYKQFACAPSSEDAQILRNVAFYDAYAGGAHHHLICPSHTRFAGTYQEYKTILENSWWKSGAHACLSAKREHSWKLKFFRFLHDG